MLERCRVTKVKVLFLELVYIFNFNLFEFSATILEKGPLHVHLSINLIFPHSHGFKSNKDFLSPLC